MPPKRTLTPRTLSRGSVAFGMGSGIDIEAQRHVSRPAQGERVIGRSAVAWQSDVARSLR
jgi:hypothetical protein